MATLGRMMADGLHKRGVHAAEAQLAAESGIAVFKIGFEQWVNSTKKTDLGATMRDLLGQLKTLAAR